MSDETQFVKLSFEQLGRLTRKDPTELKEQLTKANPDTGETLSQPEQFEVISNHMTGHFKAVVEESRNRGGKEIIKSKMRQLADKYGLDSSGELEDLIQSIEQKTIDSVKDAIKSGYMHKDSVHTYNDYEVVKIKFSDTDDQFVTYHLDGVQERVSSVSEWKRNLGMLN